MNQHILSHGAGCSRLPPEARPCAPAKRGRTLRQLCTVPSLPARPGPAFTAYRRTARLRRRRRLVFVWRSERKRRTGALASSCFAPESFPIPSDVLLAALPKSYFGPTVIWRSAAADTNTTEMINRTSRVIFAGNPGTPASRKPVDTRLLD
jgi:hypothetical protein